jgi:hypothetical protein
MNTDEIASLARKVLIMVLTSLATKLHMDGSQVAAVATDIVDLGMVAWGVYAHWDMKKVPEDARVVVTAGQAQGTGR